MKPQSARQIAEAIEQEIVLVSHTLKKLLKHEEVKYLELPWYEATEILGWKTNRRTCFFFIPTLSDPEGILQALLQAAQ